MDKHDLHEEFFTKSDLAALLHVSERTIDRYSYSTEDDKRRIEDEGKQPIHKYRAGRRVLYKASEVPGWLEGISLEDQGPGSKSSEPAPPQIRPGKAAFPRKRTSRTRSPQIPLWDSEQEKDK